MGSQPEQSGGTTVVNQTTTPTATPQETEKNQIQLDQLKQYAPQQTQMYQNAFNLGNQLLTSFGDKSGSAWQSLVGGVTQDQQNSQVQQSLRSLTPQFQQGGILDSGTAASVAGRAAADTYNSNAQFNVGAMQNALNLALSGQAQVQQPALSQSGQLSQSLAGLRSTNTSGTTTQTGYKTQTGNNLGFLGSWGGNY
jgi:hypothetical protein